jgi:hypothetical protein
MSPARQKPDELARSDDSNPPKLLIVSVSLTVSYYPTWMTSRPKARVASACRESPVTNGSRTPEISSKTRAAAT